MRAAGAAHAHDACLIKMLRASSLRLLTLLDARFAASLFRRCRSMIMMPTPALRCATI